MLTPIPGYDDLLDEVSQFIQQNLNNFFTRSCWLFSSDQIVKIYIRINHQRSLEGVLMNCLDIANLELQEKWQRKGYGSALIEDIHSVNPLEATFIENIQIPEFAESLQRKGWIKDSKYRFDLCLYKSNYSIENGRKSFIL